MLQPVELIRTALSGDSIGGILGLCLRQRRWKLVSMGYGLERGVAVQSQEVVPAPAHERSRTKRRGVWTCYLFERRRFQDFYSHFSLQPTLGYPSGVLC